MIAGSFTIHCSQTAMTTMLGPDGGTGDGAVSDAHADGAGCCMATAPVFIKLAEGDLSNEITMSPVIPVGAYREIVVYASGDCSSGLHAQFRPDGNTGFGSTAQWVSEDGGRLRVDGADLRFRLSSCGTNTTGYHYVVAGVQ